MNLPTPAPVLLGETELATLAQPRRAALLQSVDVAILGGGIPALTAGLLLVRSGCRVALIRPRRGALGVGPSTHWHASEFPECSCAALIESLGVADAREHVAAARRGLALLTRLVAATRARRLAAMRNLHLFVEGRGQDEVLEAEAAAAATLDIPVKLARRIGLPFPVGGALVVPRQLQCDFIQLQRAMAEEFAALGGVHLTGRTIIGVERRGDGLLVRTATERVAADLVLIAGLRTEPAGSDTPLMSSHALIFWMPGVGPRGLFREVGDRAHRIQCQGPEGAAMTLVAVDSPGLAQDADPEPVFSDLEAYCRHRFVVGAVGRRWRTVIPRVAESVPVVGESRRVPGVFAWTNRSPGSLAMAGYAGGLLAGVAMRRPVDWWV